MIDMNDKWFVCKNEAVLGPLTVEDVHARVQSAQVSGGDMIWGNGFAAWQKISWWQSELHKPNAFASVRVAAPAAVEVAVATPVKKTVKASDAETKFIKLADAPTRHIAIEPDSETEQVYLGRPEQTVIATRSKNDDPTVQLKVQSLTPEAWHYALAGKSHGPFDRLQLIELLQTAEPLHEVVLWSKGMKEWAPIYEFHDILSDIGANKRSFPRADLDGKAVIKGDGDAVVGSLLTISEGGLGVRLERGVRAGQIVTVEIQSRAFTTPLTVRAEVRFAVAGIVGLRFSGMDADMKKIVNDYVEQSSSTRFTLKAAG